MIYGGVAQGLEQRAHNLLVAGSIPAAPTKIRKPRQVLAFLFWYECLKLKRLFALAKIVAGS